MVSAFACKNNLVLGQVKTDDKSNEITAIPKLLDILSMKGTVVTIDAMGFQKQIADKIIEKDADYILALKANQEQLLEHIEDEFRFAKINTHHNLDYGRIEIRICSCIKDFKFIAKDIPWANLKIIIRVESTWEFKNSEKPIEKATRYYISILDANEKMFQKGNTLSLGNRK